MKKLYKIFIIISIFLYLFSLFACKKVNNENVFIEKNDANIEHIANQEFVVCEKDLLNDEASIYVLKNQSAGQVLSVVIIDEYNQALVWDGGRKEDADFLYDFLKDKCNLKVYAWFLTHCHDDHVGALYQILDEHKDDILISNIYYKFPKFEWLYNLIGVDAGAVTLVDNKIKEYAEYIKGKNAYNETLDGGYTFCNVFDDIRQRYNCIIDSGIFDIKIEVMNDMYNIENDPINNSSIVYKVSIEHSDKKGSDIIRDNTDIIILGDLSYDGGVRLLEERENDLKSDICVVAHHGQGGVWKEVYEAINPEICIWPTTKKIYENIDGKYRTDEVKGWFDEIGVKKHYTTVDNSIILR